MEIKKGDSRHPFTDSDEAGKFTRMEQIVVFGRLDGKHHAYRKPWI